MRLIINKLKWGFVTRVTEYTVFVTKTVTNYFSSSNELRIIPHFFGLKEKIRCYRGPRNLSRKGDVSIPQKHPFLSWIIPRSNRYPRIHFSLNSQLCRWLFGSFGISNKWIKLDKRWILFSLTRKLFGSDYWFHHAPNLRWVRSKTDTYLCVTRVFEVIYWTPYIHLGQTGERFLAEWGIR